MRVFDWTARCEVGRLGRRAVDSRVEVMTSYVEVGMVCFFFEEKQGKSINILRVNHAG